MTATSAGGDKILQGPAWDEFAERLKQLVAAHVFASRGLGAQMEDVMKMMQEGGKSLHIVPSPPWNWDKGLPILGEVGGAEIPSFLGPKGTVDTLIGHMWIVTVNTEWEHHYRERIAADMDIGAKDELKVPLFGDICHFRNDIVNNRGIATNEETTKVEVLTKWSTVDQLIVIGDRQMVDFLDYFGLATWEDQSHADEMQVVADMAETERKRRGLDKISMKRVGPNDPRFRRT
jgi:hypothetical protein